MSAALSNSPRCAQLDFAAVGHHSSGWGRAGEQQQAPTCLPMQLLHGDSAKYSVISGEQVRQAVSSEAGGIQQRHA